MSTLDSLCTLSTHKKFFSAQSQVSKWPKLFQEEERVPPAGQPPDRRAQHPENGELQEIQEAADPL